MDGSFAMWETLSGKRRGLSDGHQQIVGNARGKLAAFAGIALALMAPAAMGSILVHDLTENTATGVFTYSIQFDSDADVHAGDGFVIEDFPGFSGFTITDGLSTAQFSESSSLLSNSIAQSASEDAAANLARTVNGLGPDNPTIPNLSFIYDGPPNPFLGAATAVLTLDSSVTSGTTAFSAFASLDHSGPNEAVPYALAENAVLVPQPIPEPSPVTAAPLLGLVALLARRRRTPRSA
jgi:MYXO-CTERM domain-containing protein